MSPLSRASILTSALVAGVHGCADTGTNLRPAAYANQVEGIRNAATDADNRVEIVAQAAEWPGPAKITEELTPVRVWITNQSDQPARIRYSDFVLVAADGEKFAALPPLRVEGEVPVSDEVIEQPGFTYTDFEVAPYLGGVYPTIDPWTGPFATDVGYYDAYYGIWNVEAQLPTQQMIIRALPEGVIKPGGTVDGFLYFQEVPEEKRTVQFQAELAAADSGAELAQLVIPFAVRD